MAISYAPSASSTSSSSYGSSWFTLLIPGPASTELARRLHRLHSLSTPELTNGGRLAGADVLACSLAGGAALLRFCSSRVYRQVGRGGLDGPSEMCAQFMCMCAAL